MHPIKPNVAIDWISTELLSRGFVRLKLRLGQQESAERSTWQVDCIAGNRMAHSA